MAEELEGKGRVRRAASLAATGFTLYQAIEPIYQKIRSATSYTLTIEGNDGLYQTAHEWVLGELPSRQRRSLLLNYVTDSERPPLWMSYDGSRVQVINVAGHRVRVQVHSGPQPRSGSGVVAPEPERWAFSRAQDRLQFEASSVAARDALLAKLEELAHERRAKENPRQFWMVERWGNWETKRHLANRSADSLILKEGQFEKLSGDLRRFVEARADYERWGIPYHRCYLFHGPPGTGKTSIARALASEFGLDVWFIPLGDLKGDASLIDLVARVQPNSMLLLEDVDVFHATRSRDAEYNEVSLSGLLNALDGVATPQGLITVMTTNNLEVLDEALTRPGRVDVMEHIGYLDSYQVEMLFDRFWPRRGDLGKDLETTLVKKVEAGMNLTPAIIVEAFKREPHNFTLAHATILEMEKERWKD